MTNIMTDNFNLEGNQPRLDIGTLIGRGNTTTLKILEESEYLNGIKLKLMDYASSKYALNSFGYKSKGKFNSMDSKTAQFY